MKESIFALWGKRNPQYEIQYDETIVRQFCDYGIRFYIFQTLLIDSA